tara:strand:+ start:872 stop:1891 length:1020 start_codon:yes stop_codon:yes gene_type:complete
MSRIGQNPLKWIKSNEEPRKITIVTVVHIPELSGFWKDALSVLEKNINSLCANTSKPFDFMVLDNGSCKDVKNYLYDCYNCNKIQYLTFSRYNMRKIGAMNYLFSVAPGEIISFTDSDVYFEKGWLDATLDIMDTYPKAGMVSAIPTIDKSIDHYDSTLKGIIENKEIIIKSGNSLIPDNYIEAHRLSLGKSVENYMENIKDRIDTKITLNGINAYVCAQDFQFTTRKEIIAKVLPLVVTDKNIYYDPIYSPVFESKLDKLGFWRLSTEKYLIHHMGNSLKNLQPELALIRNRTEEKTNLINENKSKPIPISIRIIKYPIVRKVLKKIYSSIYKLLYES